MAIYQIADLTLAYTPRTAYTASLLAPYQAPIRAAQLSVQLSPTALAEETARLPHAHEGVVEATALLRELSGRFPAHDRLIVHAAAVIYRGDAYAFLAPSGTGKTTLARHWQARLSHQTVLLNGDRLVWHIHPDGVTAYGSPWRGKEHLGENACAPLRGVFVLTRGETPSCQPLSPVKALPHILRAVPFPSSAKERDTTLSLLEQLTRLVPLYHLHATVSVQTVDSALEALGGSL